jgi:hypothetical protein
MARSPVVIILGATLIAAFAITFLVLESSQNSISRLQGGGTPAQGAAQTPAPAPQPVFNSWRFYEYHKNMACNEGCLVGGGAVCGTAIKKTCCLSKINCVNDDCLGGTLLNLKTEVVYWFGREVREPTTCVNSGFDNITAFCEKSKPEFDKNKFGGNKNLEKAYTDLCVKPAVAAKKKSNKGGNKKN